MASGWFGNLFTGNDATPATQAQSQPSPAVAAPNAGLTHYNDYDASQFAPSQSSNVNIGGVAVLTPAESHCVVTMDGDDRRAVAREVKSLGEKRLAAAWMTLRQEYRVQTNIWESMAATRGKPRSKEEESTERRRATLTSNLDACLQTALRDPNSAIEQLGPILQGLNRERQLNHATEAAALAVQKAEKSAQNCGRLASMISSHIAGGDQSQEQLPTLIKSCALDWTMVATIVAHHGLEGRVRQALDMPPTKAEVAKIQKQTADVMASQVALAAGVDKDQAKKALAHAGGDGELAVAMLMSEQAEKAAKRESDRDRRDAKRKADRDRRDAKREAAAESKRSQAQAKGEATVVEVAELASTVSALARSTHRLAWVRVRTEWQVQLDLWNGEAALSAAAGFDTPSFEEAQAAFQALLDVAASDPEGSGPLLEALFEKLMDDGLSLCAGVREAADAILSAEWVARSRSELAARLESLASGLATGAVVKLEAGDRKELKSLLASCDFGATSTLVARVQKVIEAKLTVPVSMPTMPVKARVSL